ncbi:amino acid adenylation domain-containing protein [Streptomyces chartreusis]|uniref:amino acid adenylation domain-containing protein n=1 Tax=Streptomyces chartreusis TaxID=1969 RepID=UPI0033E50252
MDLAKGRNLVQRWRTGGPGAAPTVPGPAPMSKAQRGILVFERLHPGTAVFNLRFVARHTGHLDEERFDAALAALLRRHPALRSTFSDGDTGLVRIIQDLAAPTTRWTDLRQMPAQQREAAAVAHAERVAAEPFDLAEGPLVRVHGCRLADDQRLLVFVAHHLVCDGASMQVLLADLDAAYRDELEGQVPETQPVPAGPEALEYWRTQLAELPELDLPTDLGRPAQPTFRAGSVPLTVPADVTADAELLGRSEGATLFMVVLAAFQLLLGEHSGQSDFAIGSPEAGRSRPGQHGAVGLLSDLLVLRADLSGRPTFRELVRRARATSLAAFAHRGVPFEELVGALAPGRHVDGALVRASLAFQGEWGEPQLAGSPLVQVAAARPGLRYDVDLQVWRDRGGLWGTWDYSTEAFERATAARMAEQLPVLLARALAEPDRPVDQLDLLTEADRVLLDRWGSGPDTDDPDTSLADLFAAQVARVPDAVAIEDTRRKLTYRQLDERSNQLAHYLRGRSVEAGDIVGIRLGRSVDLAVAMLGIIKAGAAYLPLDPAYPADRTDYMLSDSSARAVVTDAELAELDAQPVSAVDIGPVPPSRLAYVLYTSGSTGRPKGVLVTHRNAVPMVLWGQRTFTQHQMSRVLASTSICFDVSVFEFFGPLCAGTTVVVVDNALSLLADPPDVTMVCSVPSAARALVAAGALPRSTEVVGLGGEAVTGTLVDDLYATGHIGAVINLYGPTEDTTYSTWAKLLPAEQPPPIGVLLPHGRGYVLDEGLRPVPVGAVGELYLAGRGVSRGYINQPALTAGRYVADPFAAVPGERMYRTGDLVRYRSDGALLYLGRRDFQIKVRGQRIELGEIETTLQRHPDVHEAVVSLQAERLVGYLTARRPGGLDLDDVRAYLRRTLPVVMVPSSLVLLDALPQTPNGKVDRLALPAPEAPVGLSGEPPQGADEELVAEVWRHVLELETVGRDDDFFDLGGDSLLAGEVLNRLRERAGGGLPLRLVFENSRLADLAAALPGPGPLVAGPEVAPRPPDAKPVLSFDQQRIWLESMVKSGTAYNVHGRQWLRGRLDIPVLERSIRAIIHRHESLRTTFPLVAGLPVQQVSDPDPHWRITIEDLSGSGSDAVAQAQRLADSQAATPFDLARGPLFDCLLVRLGDNDHLLSMTIHHIVSDGWSVGLILRELSALYRADGEPDGAELPELPVQYLDFAIWQRSALTGDRMNAHVGYWRDRLDGAPPALPLPTTRRRLPSHGAVGGRVRSVLDADGAAALHKLCRVHEVTPFMAVLAALATVLRRWSGQDDLVVGVPVNTRGAVGTDALIGLFVNTVPLRVELTGDPTFSEVLGLVRQTSVEGYVQHGETPFEALVSELRPVRDPSRTPVFQILLNMIESAESEWRLPGISVETPEHPMQPSKFDLNLDVHHSGDSYRFDLLYHAERYEPALMRALLDQLGTVLAAAADDPNRGILTYPLDTPQDDGGPTPPRAAVPHLDLRLRAQQRPDGVAVVDRKGQWTFARLADATAEVAALVAELGHDSAVCVVKRRSAGFAAAVLGCDRAQVPYTVIEPGDGPAGSLVLDPSPGPVAADHVVDVGALLREAVGALPRAATGTAPDGGAVASGATVDWAVERFGLSDEDRFGVLSGRPGLWACALSSALAAGAPLHVADDLTAADPGALVEWLHTSSVTVLHIAPPLLRTLAAQAAGRVLPLLRYVFVDNDGDLTAQDVQRVRQLAPRSRTVGLYRPTATGIPRAFYEVPTTWSAATAPLRVPIGTELAGPAVLLNPAGQPAAVGEVAEPRFGTVRTGDLVRRRPDRLLEFAVPTTAWVLGAAYADRGETVAALRDVPGVQDAVVTEYAAADGRPALAAYIVDPGGRVDPGRLRQHLVTHLPEYLIPRQVVPLERIPLTADGDYDMAALPDPVGDGAWGT